MIRVGISGWRYPPWRGVFYPKGLVQKRELAFAAESFNAIEINGTFYSLQKPSSWMSWRQEVPEDFRFAVKGGRYITHIRRLKDVETAVANFFATGIMLLGPRLGPVLWQFPRTVTFKDGRWEPFFKLLPADEVSLMEVALRHSDKVEGRTVLTTEESFPVRHAVEVRHPSFYCPEFFQLLRRYNIALVLTDDHTLWQKSMPVTADFVYVRLHGQGKALANGYQPAHLKRWHRRLLHWDGGTVPPDLPLPEEEAFHGNDGCRRDAWVFFDNDEKALAPKNAGELLRLMEDPAYGTGTGEG